MWARRRILCAALALFWGLWGLSSCWASPTSPPSASAPGSAALSAEDYDFLLSTLLAAQEENKSNSIVIEGLSQTVKDNSSVITKQSEALASSSIAIERLTRAYKTLSIVCAVLATATLVEGLALAFK